MAKNLESSIQAIIDKGAIAGAVLCARDVTGRFHYSKTIGSRTLLSGEKKAHEMNDILYLASCTKVVTTIAALQCVEAERLSLTEDVSKIAPELKEKKVITGVDADGKPTIESQKHPITLEQLLTHSSGAVHLSQPPVPQYLETSGEKFDTRPTVEAYGAGPLINQPGQGWAYGLGVDWAGKLVERVSGQKLGAYFDAHIFGPLGITDTSFYPVRDELRDRMVDLNAEDPLGEGLAVMAGMGRFNEKNDLDHFGGHGLYTTAEDYLKVLNSLLVDDGKLLKPETAALMFQPHLSPPSQAVFNDLLTTSPIAPMMRMGVGVETPRSYGLGGVLYQADVEGWHGNGTLVWGGGMNSCWLIDRKNGLCAFGAPQIKMPFNMPEVEAAKHAFRKGIYEVYQEWKAAN